MRSNNVSEPFGAILWRRVRLFTCLSDYGEDKALVDCPRREGRKRFFSWMRSRHRLLMHL
jgi:hypothetical protein